MHKQKIVIDVAGSIGGGGAKTWLETLSPFFDECSADVSVIGRTARISARWLIRREQLSAGKHLIAANNVASPFKSRHNQTVLQRNALHFKLDSDDLPNMGKWGAYKETEAAIVRGLTRKPNVIVVPSIAMKERVASRIPAVESRIHVLPHPVAPPPGLSLTHTNAEEVFVLLCPLMGAPYRPLDESLVDVLDALPQLEEAIGLKVVIRTTAPPGQTLQAHQRYSESVEHLGRLEQSEMRDAYNRADAVLYPSVFESFGYPMAEARLRGMPVVGFESQLLHDVAGPFAAPYEGGSAESLISAMKRASAAGRTPPTTNPFDPKGYLDALLDLAMSAPGK